MTTWNVIVLCVRIARSKARQYSRWLRARRFDSAWIHAAEDCELEPKANQLIAARLSADSASDNPCAAINSRA